jgi:hypothetical protein
MGEESWEIWALSPGILKNGFYRENGGLGASVKSLVLLGKSSFEEGTFPV